MVLTSGRDRLIYEIARRLSAKDWEEIESTLEQFSFPELAWKGRITGLKLAFRTIQDGPDDAVNRLAQHLGCQLESPTPQFDTTFWNDGSVRLFVSHLASHRVFAGEIGDELVNYGISSFVAHNDIEPIEEWQRTIESALATCHCVLALLHPGFHCSKWTDHEIGYGMGRNILIVPVQIGTDPYGLFGKFQAIQGHNMSTTTLAHEVFDVLNRNEETKRTLADSVLYAFGSANSYELARQRMSLLEELEYWDDHLTKTARSYLKSNDQIRDSYGVKDRLIGRIKRFRIEYMVCHE